jgi:Uma2 family endonuclease
MTIALRDVEARLPPYPVHPWSVAEYLRLVKLGLLDEDDQLELLEGWPVKKMTKNPLHDGTVDQINLVLGSRLPPGWYIRVQNVILTEDSAPEPDLAIVRGMPKDYRDQHPRPQDVGLIVEVADTSIAKDREKRHLYARAGITTYWLVNLLDRRLEVFSSPNTGRADSDYEQQHVLGTRQKVPLKIPGRREIKLSVAELFV